LGQYYVTDRALIEQLYAGNEAAARQFVMAQRFVVMSTLRRFRTFTQEDVDDLFQEVFSRLFADGCRVLRGWSGRNLEGFIRRIARNAAIDLLRSRQRAPETAPEEEADSLASDTNSPEMEALVNQLRRMMHEAIQRLEPADRAAVIAVDIEQMTYESAAAILQITRNNFGVRISRARARLASIISEQYPALLAHLENCL
jgi:RNA polymerase sigma-70 factor (ECF subfamily)